MQRILRRVLLNIGILLVIAYGGLGLYLSQGKVLEARHAPVSDYPAFDFDSGTFAEYAAYAQQYLRTQRTGRTDVTIIDNLSPFLLQPDASCPLGREGRFAKGIVLTHGLIDSPYSMRMLAEDLRARCFLVYGLLLPDHGSRPGAMLDSSWQEWAQAEHWATRRMAEQADTVLLGGHSAGGTLAVLEAAQNSQVDGLVLFAPALSISPASRYARAITLPGLLYPKAAWFEVDADEALYRYESFTFKSAAETWALIKETWQQENATHPNLPVFTVAALPDNTVGTAATLEYMAGNTHPASATLLFAQHEQAPVPGITVIDSANTETGVLSMSHLGLMTPQEHPYFGFNGRYRNCEHYADAKDNSFAQCKAGERDFYAEATAENLARGLVERTAFNPHYTLMLEHLERFLATFGDPASQ